MKFFIAFALIAAVATATPLRPVPLSGELAEIAEIVAAIQSPSTDPATAAALETMLLETLGLSPAPISVGPAIIEPNPISVGPALIDFPLPDGGEVTAVEPSPVVVPTPVVQPSPVVIGEVPAGASPLVQIIVNVNQQESSPAVVAPAPVETPVIDEVYVPGPVNVADNVDAPVVPAPVVIPTPVLPEIVIPTPVVVGTPIIPEPISIDRPIIPSPVVVLPEELN